MSKHHVIIGGGPAATNALETLRKMETETSEITLISDEPAHSRMAIPYWLANQIPKSQTMTSDEATWKKLNVTARIGETVQHINPAEHFLQLDDGSQLKYDDLLLAVGSMPIDLPVEGADLSGVEHLWRLDQTERLLEGTKDCKKPHVVMIGAGFIGFIMLNAMYKRGWKLTVIEREQHVLPRMLDAGSAEIMQSWLNAKEVSLCLGTSVAAIREAENEQRVVVLDDGQEITCDAVVVGIGVRPNLSLIDGTGIQVDHGILVDEFMQTNVADIYAAGDVAQGPVLGSNTFEVHALHPTAVDHGRIAGANMAGKKIAYRGSLSMNVLDVCGLQTASFGNWSDPSAEETVISSPSGNVYRKLLWTQDQLSGAIFLGQANDLGMLTDVGMVKGIMQTQTGLGEWKEYLQDNPFDVRRPFVAKNVAKKLIQTTLLEEPSQERSYRFENAKAETTVTPAHDVYVNTKAES